jgi:hypothetical protein
MIQPINVSKVQISFKLGCPLAAKTYAEESTRKCVLACTLGTFADPTTLKCVSSIYFTN